MPRAALVIQPELFDGLASVTVLPVTIGLRSAPLLGIPIKPFHVSLLKVCRLRPGGAPRFGRTGHRILRYRSDGRSRWQQSTQGQSRRELGAVLRGRGH
jgi:hypothetical protein